MTTDQASHAALCCPAFALRLLTAGELAALDAWCARALHDEDAEPRPEERPAVDAYFAALRALGATVGRAAGVTHRHSRRT